MNPKYIDLRATFDAELKAGADGVPTFSALAYGGGAFAPHLNPPLPHPVVLDLAGMTARKQSLPILRDHDAKRHVGHSTTFANDQRTLSIDGVISGGGPDAAEVVAAAKKGFVWPASISAGLAGIEKLDAGKTAFVNGRTVTGPAFIARKSEVTELSFLTVAADPAAEARIAAQKENMTTLPNQAGNPATATMNATTNDPVAAELAAEKQKQADAQAIALHFEKARDKHPAKAEVIQALAMQAADKGWDPMKVELELLRAMRPQARPYFHADAGGTEDNAVISAALCLAGGLNNIETHFKEPILEAASSQYKHGLGLCEVLRIFAHRNGHPIFGNRDPQTLLRAAFAATHTLRADGPSTLSLPGILSNVANKFMLTGFNLVESTWRGIASIKPVKDFKQNSSYSLTGDFTYRKVAPGGQLEHAVPGEKSYTNQANTYGRMFAIDRRDIINDDLGALTQTPLKLGRGAALEFNKIFWTEFLADHTSGGTFFPTDGSKGNYISGATAGLGTDSRLNIDGLNYAEQKFYDQTDPDGQPLGITPAILLVPNSLNAQASNLMRSTEIRDTVSAAYPTGNPHMGKFTPIRSSYLNNSAMGGAYSTAFWYLLAAPAELSFIEVAFLNGIEVPTVESADAEFEQLGIQMRGFMDFGCKKQEYRAAVKSKGAA